MKHLFTFVTALFLCLFVASVICHVFGIEAIMKPFLAMVALSFLYSLVPKAAGATAVVLQQMWETELIEKFREAKDWLGTIPRKDKYVNNNAINLTEIGADPNVLINNTTYPIAVVSRTDDNIVLSLNKYDSENTRITDDELYALPYDKEDSVIRQHRLSITEKVTQHGLHILCPAGNTADTPVIVTTGGDNGGGRKRLTTQNVIAMKARLDALKIPSAGRVLVLCTDHVNDLLIEDLTFRTRYQDVKTGAIMSNFYGFQVFEDVYNPVFDATNAKKAFGAAGAGTDRNASTVYYAPRAFQASGETKMYYAAASTNPTMRETVVGFRQWHIVAPKKNVGFGAIVSDAV